MTEEFDEMWRLNAEYVIGKKWVPTKRYDSKTYYRYGEGNSTKHASKVAKALRRVGYLVRLQDHSKRGYIIWVRRKK